MRPKISVKKTTEEAADHRRRDAVIVFDAHCKTAPRQHPKQLAIAAQSSPNDWALHSQPEASR